LGTVHQFLGTVLQVSYRVNHNKYWKTAILKLYKFSVININMWKQCL